jgi:hypothetical protein
MHCHQVAQECARLEIAPDEDRHVQEASKGQVRGKGGRGIER